MPLLGPTPPDRPPRHLSDSCSRPPAPLAPNAGDRHAGAPSNQPHPDMTTDSDDRTDRLDPGYDVSAAIDLVEPAKPLVLSDGLVVTDNGHLITSQYVDIAPGRAAKTAVRPPILVKATELRHALEFSPTIQISSPHRFREYGESGIRDAQEGRATNESSTVTEDPSYTPRLLEQQEALRRLHCNPSIAISETVARHRDIDSRSLTFGRSAWIYCTSLWPTPDRRDRWRASLPAGYDHESVIRQPMRFALALATAFADQHGPRGQPTDFDHTMHGAIRSVHATQTVTHGPVWYTDDVYGFLSSRIRDDPLYHFYALFVKPSAYRDQLEYRFALHCESPVEGETLLLAVVDDMRATFSPHGESTRVTFQAVPDQDQSVRPSPVRVAESVNTVKSTSRTRRDRIETRWTVTDNRSGTSVQEGTQVTEQEVAVTSEASGTGVDPNADPESTPAELVRITRGARRTKTVGGALLDTATESRTMVFTLGQRSEFSDVFELEEPAQLLDAAAKPFSRITRWPPAVASLLEGLARQTVNVDPEAEVEVWSACWNAIWAVANVCCEFGDVVESVDIEEGKFVAVWLKESDAGVRGRILVGPRGTFAYLLSPVGFSHHGGIPHRLILFPDDQARSHFEHAGWSPLENARADREGE